MAKFENKDLGVKITVNKNYEWNDWIVRVYINGEKNDDVTSYHGEDKEDAMDTGKMLFDQFCERVTNKMIEECAKDNLEELLPPEKEKNMLIKPEEAVEAIKKVVNNLHDIDEIERIFNAIYARGIKKVIVNNGFGEYEMFEREDKHQEFGDYPFFRS